MDSYENIMRELEQIKKPSECNSVVEAWRIGAIQMDYIARFSANYPDLSDKSEQKIYEFYIDRMFKGSNYNSVIYHKCFDEFMNIQDESLSYIKGLYIALLNGHDA